MSRRLAEGFDGDVERRPRGPVEAVVALGANLGDRAATLAAAVNDLRALPLVDAVRVSEPIESVAVKPDGPDAAAPAYLNAVALVTTRLAPSVLLGYLHAIEAAARPARRASPRAAGAIARSTSTSSRTATSAATIPGSLLPHPRAAERDFVLGPWLSLDPDAVLPGEGRVDALLERLRERGRR